MILFPDNNFLLPDKTKILNFPKEKKEKPPTQHTIQFQNCVVFSQNHSLCWKMKLCEELCCDQRVSWSTAFVTKPKTMFSFQFNSKLFWLRHCVKTNKQKGSFNYQKWIVLFFAFTTVHWYACCTYLGCDTRNIYSCIISSTVQHRFPASHDSTRICTGSHWCTSSQPGETMAPCTSQPLLIVSA